MTKHEETPSPAPSGRPLVRQSASGIAGFSEATPFRRIRAQFDAEIREFLKVLT
jgi:hypothetical protein